MKTLYVAICFVVISFGGRAQTFSWGGLAYIFDFQTDTIHVPVSGLSSTIDTTFGIAHICFNITHTYDADLSVKLVSPAGTTVSLIQTKGGSGDNFIGTCVGMD